MTSYVEVGKELVFVKPADYELNVVGIMAVPLSDGRIVIIPNEDIPDARIEFRKIQGAEPAPHIFEDVPQAHYYDLSGDPVDYVFKDNVTIGK